MVDVLGSTENKGLGGQGKRSAGAYQGGNVRLNTGGVSGGIGLSSGRISAGAGAGINAPLIQARTIQPFVAETPRAQGPALSGEAVERGMTQLAISVERYADDVATLRAQEAAITFNSSMRDLFHGNSEKGTVGYRNTKGFASIDGYTEYQSQVNEAMQTALAELPPAARQKAVMNMFATRDSYLNKGSQHAVSEKDKYNEYLNQKERVDIERDFSAFPPDALAQVKVDEEGNQYTVESRLKQRWFSTYDPEQLELAQSKWESLVEATAKSLYYASPSVVDKNGNYSVGEGLQELTAFRNLIATNHLPKTKLGELDRFIQQAESQEAIKYNQAESIRDRKEAKTQKRVQVTNFVNALVSLRDPNSEEMSITDALNKVKAGTMTVPQFNTYERAVLKKHEVKDEGVSDYGLVLELDTMINEAAGSSSILDQTSSIGQLIEESNLSGSLKYGLVRRLADSGNKEVSANRKLAREQIGFTINPTYRSPTQQELRENISWTQSTQVKTDEEKKIEFEAYQYYVELTSGETPLRHTEALKKVTTEYTGGKRQFDLLGPIGSYGKPSSSKQLEQLFVKMTKDLYNADIDQNKFDELFDIAAEYEKHFTKFPSEVR